MKKLLWIVLLCSLLFLFGGCQSETDRLMGQWYAQIDVGHLLARRLETESPEFATVMPDTSVKVTVVLTFYADGTYRCQADRESVEIACEEYTQVLEKAIWEYMLILHERKETGITLEAYLQSVNLTRQQLLQEVIGTSLADELMIQMNLRFEGRFAIEKGKLSMSDSLAQEPQADSYHVCQLEEACFTLQSGSYQNREDATYYASILPLTFQK